MSESTITVLSIEDNDAEAELIEELLAESPQLGWNLPHFEVIHAPTVTAGLQCLDAGEIDVILSDLDLPDSRSGDTFAKIHAHAPTLPIVVLTGREDKALARRTVRLGAEDYLFKREMTSSLLAHALIYAIERKRAQCALQEAHNTLERRVEARTEALAQKNRALNAEIAERQRVEAQRESALAALKESEQKYRMLVERSLQGMVIAQDNPMRLVFASKPMEQISGYPPEVLTSLSPQQLAALIHPQDRATFFQNFRDRLQGKDIPSQDEYRIIHKDGEIRRVEIFSTRIEYEGEPATQTAFLDVTKRERSERTLQEREQHYQALINSMRDDIVVLDTDFRTVRTNREGDQGPCYAAGYGFEANCAWCPAQRALATGEVQSVTVPLPEENPQHWFHLEASPIRNAEGEITHIVESTRDVTEQTRMQRQWEEALEALQASKAQYQRLAESADAVLWEYDVSADRWTYVAPQVTEILGHPPEAWTDFQFWIEHLHPEDREWARDYCMRCTRRGESHVFEYRFLKPNGAAVWVRDVVSVEMKDGQPTRLQGFMIDITERKEAEQAVERYAADLQRSNQELEQFGYVVSHDLREPLRAVKSYLTLLERYRDKLDATANMYIDYAVEGADRMQAMIRALLNLSRVETQGRTFAPTPLADVLAQALTALRPTIEETGAVITHDPLPTVMADAAQLAQVFQNLIANAIKFRRKGVPPRVHVAADRQPLAGPSYRGEDSVSPPAGETKGRSADGGEWRFSVADNGIGIDPDHADRLFQIFQRLHAEDEYEGLGIGLALCKRIVERHGGRIWVESTPDEGATFVFTIPTEREAR
jgi:PAS domain S-box-containing protein